MYTLIFPNEKILKTIRFFNNQLDKCTNEETFNNFEDHALTYDSNRAFDVKYSAFNYWEHRDNIHVVFNSLYNTLAVFSNETYAKYANLDTADKKLRDKLYKLGLVVDDDVKELETYLGYASMARKWKSRKLRLVITTTMCCNARCAYCYEAGIKQSSFDNYQKEALLKFIDQQSSEDGIGITWFGGEPLLNTELIDFVTEHLIKINADYSAYIITNGSLLTKYMLIEKFSYWHIGAMQITIDGTKDNYLRIKNYKNTNTDYFKKLIENIKIADSAGINVDIRLNIDQDNLTDIFSLEKYLEEEFSDCVHVSMYPAFIAGTPTIIPEDQRVAVIKELLLNLKDPDKASFVSKLHKEARIAPCNIADYRSFGIDVYGYLHNCEHYVGKESYSIGTLKDGLYNDDLRKKEIDLDIKCKKCVWLPQCFGGCQAHRIDGDVPCMIERYMLPAYIMYLADYLEDQEEQPLV